MLTRINIEGLPAPHCALSQRPAFYEIRFHPQTRRADITTGQTGGRQAR
jgi:hypothetical protein